MTPVPLELPLNPGEAAELANLIFGHAERKPLTDELRNRIAARAGVLRLQSFHPYCASLERDPVHHSVYYLAVDAGTTPLLLHIALNTAPTSSIYHKPLLICRARRNSGPEIVINAIAFGPVDHDNVETFAARINAAFYPQPQGARSTITVDQDYAAGFATFRSLQKRTGKNLAAFAGDYHAALCAAIRAGWRAPYTVVTRETPRVAAFSRYVVAIRPTPAGLDEAERQYQKIRHARAAAKLSRPFDLAIEATSLMSPDFLRETLSYFKELGHPPQIVAPGPVQPKDLDAMTAAALSSQTTLSFQYQGESPATLHAIAKATTGRFDYRVRNASELEFVAEHLL